ncbi:MAG: flagellar protein FliS, partial [Spirochaetales bacterium]
IVKAQDCITELTAGLDFEQGGQLASSLYNLYRYFHRELTEANISKDPARVGGVRRFMNELRGAWSQIAAAQPASGGSGYGASNRNADSGGNINFSG